MSDREAILERIRRTAAHAQPHPGPHPETSGPASFERFAEALRAAGAEVHGPLPHADLAAGVLERARSWAAGGRVVAEPSAARVLGGSAFDAAPEDAAPDSFAHVAVAIASGFLGVAENGAVAVLGRDAPHRSLLVLAQRLVLLLPAKRIVSDLHAAFRALPPDALDAPHLTWIAGPSKTADIEQTVVLGAHGPRSLALFAYLEES